MRIFVSRLSALGDVVCSLPAAVALRKQWPDAEIVWAVDPRFAGVVECCSAVSTVVKIKPSWSSRTWQAATGEFDLALDLQGLLKSALPVAVCRAKRKLGYHWQREGSWLFSAKVIPDPSSLHVVDQYVDVARAAGAVCDRAEFHLWPTPESLVRVRNLLNEHGVYSKFVVANAGAGWPTKRWPATHFAELSRMLHEMKIPVVFIGAKSAADVDAMREVQAAGAEHAINLLGKTSVPDLIALVALAAAHVGGDTGSSHIAAALGKPAVGLYSITRPERTCPYGQIERCLYDPRGLAQISVDAALDKVKEALS